ncbi:MAG: SEC-C metal-binding domain-containing protein, partial [Gammaproteobacteria bacterium]
QEYKREAFSMFSELLEKLKHEVVKVLCRVQVRAPEDVREMEARRQAAPAKMEFQHAAAPDAVSGPQRVASPEQFVRSDAKVGRNDPCPCGSGKKYKHCHGRISS